MANSFVDEDTMRCDVRWYIVWKVDSLKRFECGKVGNFMAVYSDFIAISVEIRFVLPIKRSRLSSYIVNNFNCPINRSRFHSIIHCTSNSTIVKPKISSSFRGWPTKQTETRLFTNRNKACSRGKVLSIARRTLFSTTSFFSNCFDGVRHLYVDNKISYWPEATLGPINFAKLKSNYRGRFESGTKDQRKEESFHLAHRTLFCYETEERRTRARAEKRNPTQGRNVNQTQRNSILYPSSS